MAHHAIGNALQANFQVDYVVVYRFLDKSIDTAEQFGIFADMI